jgi:hypothetical protein
MADIRTNTNLEHDDDDDDDLEEEEEKEVPPTPPLLLLPRRLWPCICFEMDPIQSNSEIDR